MPRLFTALEIPHDIAADLALIRGLPDARWIEPADYHVTLRFIGDVDMSTAGSIAETLDQIRSAPIAITLDGLDAFGGRKPRAIFSKVVPSGPLAALQEDHETLLRRLGLKPETRRFTPHMTLARLRGASPATVAAFLGGCGFPPRTFTASRFVLMSSRASTGGGPYVVEAAYPLG